MPDFHLPLAFYGDLTDICTIELILNQLIRVACDLDLAARAMTLHARCCVDDIAPNGIEKFLTPNHAANHQTRIQSDADFNGMFATQKISVPDVVEHIDCHPRQDCGMVWPRGGDTRRDHVSISGNLNLLDIVFLHKLIEFCEQIVEHIHDLPRTEAGGDWGKVYDIRHQDSCRAELLRNGLIALL